MTVTTAPAPTPTATTTPVDQQQPAPTRGRGNSEEKRGENGKGPKPKRELTKAEIQQAEDMLIQQTDSALVLNKPVRAEDLLGAVRDRISAHRAAAA